jgi:hypothetical protein
VRLFFIRTRHDSYDYTPGGYGRTYRRE